MNNGRLNMKREEDEVKVKRDNEEGRKGGK